MHTACLKALCKAVRKVGGKIVFTQVSMRLDFVFPMAKIAALYVNPFKSYSKNTRALFFKWTLVLKKFSMARKDE